MRIKLPRLIEIIDDGIHHVPSSMLGLSRAIVGCILPPEMGICIPSKRKIIWLVLGVSADSLKKRYPKIFNRFKEEIRIFCQDGLSFCGGEYKIIS